MRISPAINGGASCCPSYVAEPFTLGRNSRWIQLDVVPDSHRVADGQCVFSVFSTGLETDHDQADCQDGENGERHHDELRWPWRWCY